MKRLLLSLLLCAAPFLTFHSSPFTTEASAREVKTDQGLAMQPDEKIQWMPMEGTELRSDVWGADSVRPRLVDNGIEYGVWSYWGGNIVRGDDDFAGKLLVRRRDGRMTFGFVRLPWFIQSGD